MVFLSNNKHTYLIYLVYIKVILNLLYLSNFLNYLFNYDLLTLNSLCVADLIIVTFCLLFIILFFMHLSFILVMSQIINSSLIVITYILVYYGVILYSNFIHILLNNLNANNHCKFICWFIFVYFYNNVIMFLKVLMCYIRYCCFIMVNYYSNCHIIIANNLCADCLFKAILYWFLIFNSYIAFIIVVWILCCDCLCFCCNAAGGGFCCFVLGCRKCHYCKYVCNPITVLSFTSSINNFFVILSKSILVAVFLIFSFHICGFSFILSLYIERP